MSTSQSHRTKVLERVRKHREKVRSTPEGHARMKAKHCVISARSRQKKEEELKQLEQEVKFYKEKLGLSEAGPGVPGGASGASDASGVSEFTNSELKAWQHSNDHSPADSEENKKSALFGKPRKKYSPPESELQKMSKEELSEWRKEERNKRKRIRNQTIALSKKAKKENLEAELNFLKSEYAKFQQKHGTESLGEIFQQKQGSSVVSTVLKDDNSNLFKEDFPPPAPSLPATPSKGMADSTSVIEDVPPAPMLSSTPCKATSTSPSLIKDISPPPILSSNPTENTSSISNICFGGKVGGQPSWLNPRDLPLETPLRCRGPCSQDSNSGTPMRFIAQVYCPADDDTLNPAAFHRTLYVFVCPKCLTRNSANNPESVTRFSDCIRVLRCQLPKENDFLSADGTINNEKIESCSVCGQRGKGKCPNLNLWFCGDSHRQEYLNAMKQKQDKLAGQNTFSMENQHLLFPSLCYECELVAEEEPFSETHRPLTAGNADQQIPSVSQTPSIPLGQNGNTVTKSMQLMGELAGTINLTFYAQTKIEGSERLTKTPYLFYSRWPTNTGSKAPSCQYCGAERSLELKIRSQMLGNLMNDHTNALQNTNSQLTSSKGNNVSSLVKAVLPRGANEEAHSSVMTACDALLGFTGAVSTGSESTKVTPPRSSNGEIDVNRSEWGSISVYTCTASCGDGGPVCFDNTTLAKGKEREELDLMGAYREEVAYLNPVFRADAIS